LLRLFGGARRSYTAAMGGTHDAWGLRATALALAGMAGAALQLQQPALWSTAAYAAVLALALASFIAARSIGRARMALLVCAVAGLFFAATGLRAGWRLADALPAALEGQDIVVTGVVAELPTQNPDGVRFNFDVEQAGRDGAPVAVPQRIALGWYRGWDEDALIAAPFEALRAGQRWRFTVRLKAPHGTLNPHGFDVELWLFEQGLRATGTVRATERAPAERLQDNAAHPVERLRQTVRDAIVLRVADPRAAGVLAALAVGDQAAIERSDWELFRATGIAHLVSISGLHVTMFAWLAGSLLGWLWRRSERAMLTLPAPLAARWGGVVAAALYALLAGWGVPAQRTVWMLATAALLASLGVRWPWPLVLLAAALVVTAIDPWALLQAGFWLSFAAVGLLMASVPVQQDKPPPANRRQAIAHALRDGLRTQVVATLALTPLTLVFFQQVSVVGFIANLVAIPLVTLVITPLALLGVLLPPLWQAGAWLVQAMAQGLAFLASWPDAVWTAGVAPWWAQVAGLFGALLLVAPLPWRLRAMALPLMLPLVVPPQPRPAEGAMHITVADIGQGSAVLVRTRDHLLIHDAGPQYSRESEAGTRVLLPLLRAEATRRIDLLMLSHRDADHVGGAAALLAGLPVTALSSSLEASHPLLAGRVPHTRCEAGQHWQWDGVSFAVLHPMAEDYERTGLKPNAMSCVLHITDAAGRSVLLTGDLEAAQELRLVQSDAAALRSTLLLVPHHGSKTSSTNSFLDAVAPRVAVLQAGYRNRYGHPAPPVLARYAEHGIGVARTDDCGAWTWHPDDAEAAGHCERDTAARYWHHRRSGDGANIATR
jgi:competence protein ComEC